jgi:pyruvate formate lyase activating enzyme
MDAEAAWLCSLSPELPLHISRFFPHYRMLDVPPTPVETIRRLVRVAEKHLRYVYAGNC